MNFNHAAVIIHIIVQDLGISGKNPRLRVKVIPVSVDFVPAGISDSIFEVVEISLFVLHPAGNGLTVFTADGNALLGLRERIAVCIQKLVRSKGGNCL